MLKPSPETKSVASASVKARPPPLKALATTPHDKLPAALDKAGLEIQVHTESEVSPWLKTDLDGLAGQLNRVYESLIQDDVVNRAIEILQDGVVLARKEFTITTPASK